MSESDEPDACRRCACWLVYAALGIVGYVAVVAWSAEARVERVEKHLGIRTGSHR